MSRSDTKAAIRSLLIGLFASLLSGTVVTTALPRVITDLDGGQSAYTWVVAATMVTTILSLPLWGKFADLTNPKTLIHCALGLFALGSALAGLAQNLPLLIAGRAVQGLGVGGITALTQVIMAMLIPSHERSRYNGRLALVMMGGTVCGPLVGGTVADVPWLGWRWCFHLGLPLAAAAALTLHRTLRLPPSGDGLRASSLDIRGAFLLTATIGTLLAGISLVGTGLSPMSWEFTATVCALVVSAAAFLRTERRAADPLIPTRLLRNRTVVLTAVADFAAGPALFASPALLGQYFQIARGQSPTVSGLLCLPMVAGLLLSATVSGHLISAKGRWKAHLTAGGVLLLLSFSLMGTVRADTPLLLVGVYLFTGGAGMGMTSQNLVLIAQNAVPPAELGATGSMVALCRNLGGLFGVTVLGGALAARVDTLTESAGAMAAGESAVRDGRLPDLRALPPDTADFIQSVYGRALGDVFALSVPFALITLLAVLALPERPLRPAREPEATAGTAHGPGR
ncbi:MFS transporter [Streptomyces sp. NEAU-W12]|uniref:MFS transporter n=1 Tax=Streptomyces sp. NEAU-W12 TaxID=2994668 RepID=UPI00224A5716|nr:MFS transporter [Streptomyces sp. NEAU-W12]MCX2927974.1 MFS transporter [Streptomyces sp. NEAU-W12]